MKPLPTRILIPIHRPGLWLVVIAVLVVGMCALLWSAYLYGQRQAGYDRSQAIKVISTLRDQVEDLQKQSAANQHQAAMIERTSQIDDDANKQLKKSLTDSQQQVLDLKKQLAFYKSVVSPGAEKRRAEVQSITLQKDDAGSYQYKLMVSQRGRNDRMLRGSIKITLEGTKSGKPVVLDILNNRTHAAKFSFKYFQNFEGTVKLPANFTPENLQVVISPTSYGVEKVDEEYSWTDLISGGN